MVACTQTLLFLFLFSTTSERTHYFLKVVVSSLELRRGVGGGRGGEGNKGFNK